ncbi:MAG: M15 family metallopeptidase [Erysipelotrichaceae bacterium]
MLKKRIGFIVVLFAIFVASFYQMNLRFDPLARYPYADQANRELLLEHLSTTDISYIIQQQITPERFEPYLGIEGFNITHIAMYEVVAQHESDLKQVVRFINEQENHFNLDELERLLANYPYTMLANFYDYGNSYISNAILEKQPSNLATTLVLKETLQQYQPSDLVPLTAMPSVRFSIDNSKLRIRSIVQEPLSLLCEEITQLNDKTCGNLIAVRAFTSYEQQIAVHEAALLEYGIDLVLDYESYPGQSEYQLGTSILMSLPKVETEELVESEQVEWLNDNAHRFGFIVRYPETKTTITKHEYNPLLLRYVGVELATKMHEEGLVLEEVRIDE